MHCAGFEARLNQLLDERRRPEYDDELLAHAETCDTCREDLAIGEQLFAGLEMSRPPLMRESFARDIVAEVLCASPVDVPMATLVEPRRGNRAAVWRIAGTAIAASLLLALVPLANRLGRESTPPAPQATELVNTDTPEQAVPAPSKDDNIIPASDFVRTVYASIQEVPVDRSVDRVPGIRPVVTSVGLAIGVVRRTIPGQSTQSLPPAGDENKSPTPSKPQAEYSRDLAAASLV